MFRRTEPSSGCVKTTESERLSLYSIICQFKVKLNLDSLKYIYIYFAKFIYIYILQNLCCLRSLFWPYESLGPVEWHRVNALKTFKTKQRGVI